MKTFIQNKLTCAFTMIELVFVIVVVGIISAMIAPNFQGDNAREAADQIISHIRYTQHLAMMDDKFDDKNSTWFKNRWNITFAPDSADPTNNVYWIKDNGAAIGTRDDYAKNPLDTTSILSGDSTFDGNGTKNLNLTSKYGVTVTPASTIYFDYLGRPYTGVTSVYGNILTSSYDINVSDGAKTITIRIEPETGYTHILTN